MTDIEPAEEVIYYAYRTKPPEVSGVDFEISGFGHRGFRCTRDPAYLIYSIAYEDGRLPPVPLAGRFTDKKLVIETIDAYLLNESRKQAGEA
jgi:hypothetical protein